MFSNGTAIVGRPNTVLLYENLFLIIKVSLSSSKIEKGAEQVFPTSQSLKSFGWESREVTQIELLLM